DPCPGPRARGPEGARERRRAGHGEDRRQPRPGEGRQGALGGARPGRERRAVSRERRGGRGHGRDPGGRRRRLTGVVVMRDVMVIGGGCYGTFYAGQLAKAKARGRADYRCVVVVDRDPGCRARTELGEAPDRRFVSRDWSAYFATALGGATRPRPDEPQDYIVPSPLMPHLMVEWVRARAREGCRRPLFGRAWGVFRRPDFGVGAFSGHAVLEGDASVRQAGESGEPAAVLVATIPRCDGAPKRGRVGAGKPTSDIRRQSSAQSS